MSNYNFKKHKINDRAFIMEFEGKFYPYNFDGNQVSWNGWICNNQSVEGIQYVSQSYASLASAKRVAAKV